MSKAKTLTLTFYSDPGHGWMRVPCKLLEELRITDDISRFSYLSGTHAYLEEDCDANILDRAARAAGYELVIEVTMASKEARIRSYPSYSPDSCRERAVRPTPTSGLVAEYGAATYTLKRDLGRKGWEVERADGLVCRMNVIQLAHARLRHA